MLEVLYGKNINYETIFCDNTKRELFSKFDCGNKDINEYLYKAHADYINGLGVTKLIIDMDKEKILAYYTICTTSLLYDTTNKNKIKGFPAVEIKMFALDKGYQDISYSEDYDDGTLSDYLLTNLVCDIIGLSETVGIKFIVLYAVPDSYKFYKRNMFFDYKEIMIDMYDRFTEGCIPMQMMIE